ncbi:MAG: ribonuclease HII [Alteromonadaceae bacterium]|nr:ribonuclease HII [Alteromonadaceae bacterium]MBH85899.1 ribonuclease HII [Alteromonadaceae bacterium]MBH87519.1 ribonuclease HII [Alteromonadaceae bacterium]
MGELKGYEIVYGRNANELNQRVVINDASVMSYTVDGLSEGDWYFAIRVLDTENLSSPLSAVVSKSI